MAGSDHDWFPTHAVESRPFDPLENLRIELSLFAGDRAPATTAPRDLGLGIANEVATMLEQFKGRTDEQIVDAMRTGERTEIAATLTVVFTYLVRLADVLGIDLLEAASEVAGDRRITKNGAAAEPVDHIVWRPASEYADIFPDD